MLNDSQVQEFRERGLLLGPVVYSGAEADALRDRMHAIIEGRSPGKPEMLRNLAGSDERVVIQIVNAWEADDLFRAHTAQPEMCGMVA